MILPIEYVSNLKKNASKTMKPHKMNALLVQKLFQPVMPEQASKKEEKGEGDLAKINSTMHQSSFCFFETFHFSMLCFSLFCQFSIP